MTDEPKFTHIAVEKPAQKQIAILARVRGVTIYELVAGWANEAWGQAEQEGLVTDAMLTPMKAHVLGKEHIVEFDAQDGKKLLKAVKMHKGGKA